MIFQLIYTCALANDVTCKDLESIAQTSRASNARKNITGILLCNEGSALQVLEGDRDTVLSLYQKIEADPRTSNPLVLIKRMTENREFPDWSMGYKRGGKTDAAFKLSMDTFSEAMPDTISPEVGTIGRTFARVSGLN